jgi:glycosyltransferase involved in cell wall biosynthesis
MDAGVPIVATPVGGTQMQLGEIGAPYLVPVGDAQELAEQLLLLINDPQLRHNYGNGLHYRVLKYFDMEHIANGYMCAYQRLGTSSNANLANCAHLPAK